MILVRLSVEELLMQEPWDFSVAVKEKVTCVRVRCMLPVRLVKTVIVAPQWTGDYWLVSHLCPIGVIAWPSHLPGMAAPTRWIHRIICQLYLDTFYSCFFSSWRNDCSISTVVLRFSFDVSIQHVKLSGAVPANLFTTGVFLPCKLILHY